MRPRGRAEGRDYLLFQEMAKRGGFNVEWALTRDVSKTVPESYTAMAVNFTTDDRFDLSTNWWTDTSDRRKLGLVIGHHHTDASRVLITARNSKKKSLDLDLLVRPFGPCVGGLVRNYCDVFNHDVHHRAQLDR